MAELDIKDIWQKGKLQRADEVEVNVDEVVGKKSKDVLYWVKFVLWIEFWINVVSIPLFLVALMAEDATRIDQYLFGGGIIVIIAYLFYYQFLIRSISRFDYAGDVKGSLTKVYKYLKFYILHYKVVVWVLVPLSSIISFITALNEMAATEPEDPELQRKAFWISIALLVVFIALFSLLLNFLVNRIYGRKIKRLKGLVSQL